MTADEQIRLAEDVFTVDSIIVSDKAGPQVRLIVDTPESDIEMTMAPESALWLARELWQASGLPMDHNLRFRRRSS